jgi:hypothetical protein
VKAGGAIGVTDLHRAAKGLVGGVQAGGSILATHGPDVIHRGPQSREGRGEEWAIAAEASVLADELEVRAFAGSPGDAGGKVGDGGDGRVALGRHVTAGVDHLDDGVEEAIEADERSNGA